MNEESIRQHIVDTFPDVDIVPATGGTFFFDDGKRMFPFVTIVTSDEYDRFSNLTREGVFRLNVGVSKESFRSLFSTDSQHDFTALDQVMPHPVYGKMHWICVLNPSEETFEKLKPLIADAYAISKQRSRGL